MCGNPVGEEECRFCGLEGDVVGVNRGIERSTKDEGE